MTTYTAHVEEDPETKELVLVFPEGLMEQVGWNIGDNIQWIDNKNGSWTLKRKEGNDSES
jgi:hypothetical protein